MIRSAVLITAVLLIDVFLGLPRAEAQLEQDTDVVVAEDYALYDQVVTSKFLTSKTQLIVIERMTRFRLSPDQDGPATIEAFQEEEYFDGELPTDLIREFIAVNRHSSRLEGRFHFGIGYRFVTGDTLEDPEVSLARPVMAARAKSVESSPVLDRLAFSRVARSLLKDQALMYVEALRPDGSGAGFLSWWRRRGESWTLFDTEVTWTIQALAEPDGEPPLAP